MTTEREALLKYEAQFIFNNVMETALSNEVKKRQLSDKHHELITSNSGIDREIAAELNSLMNAS